MCKCCVYSLDMISIVMHYSDINYSHAMNKHTLSTTCQSIALIENKVKQVNTTAYIANLA